MDRSSLAARYTVIALLVLVGLARVPSFATSTLDLAAGASGVLAGGVVLYYLLIVEKRKNEEEEPADTSTS